MSVEDAARCRLRRKAAAGEVELSGPGADVAAALATEAGSSEGGAIAEAAEPHSAADLSTGRVFLGFVKASGKGGVFVALPGGREARAKARELTNGFVRDIAAAFPPGRLVRCRVLEQDAGARADQLELSLRPPGRLRGEPRPCPAEGAAVEAVVRKVGQFGAFLDVPGGAFRGCSGLVPSSELPRRGGVEPGARLRCVVTDASRGPSRLGLTLATGSAEAAEVRGAPHTGDAAMGDVALDADDSTSSEGGEGSESEGEERSDGGGNANSDSLDEDMENAEDTDDSEEDGGDAFATAYDARHAEDSDSENDEDEEEEDDDEADGFAHALAVGGGASAPEAAEVPSDGEARLDGPLGRSAAKRAARRRADAREEAAQAVERGALAAAKGDFRLGANAGDGDGGAHSVEALRAWCLGEPGDSYRWVRLMARQQAGGDSEGARAAAAEALRRIPAEAEGERLNVHAALMGLEAQEGGEAGCLAAFRAALPTCDRKRLSLALLDVLEGVPASDREARAEALRGALKRLRQQCPGSCKVAAREAEHHLLGRGANVRGGDAKASLAAVQAGLKRLERRKHPKLLRRVAVEAFRAGGTEGPELGRHLLEAALAGWPKRSDLWLLYAAQEEALWRKGPVKASGGRAHGGEPGAEKVRRVFERAVGAAGTSAKRARPALRAWAEFEKRQGDSGRPEAVREAALALLGGGDRD